MRNQPRVIFAVILITFGVLLIVGQVFNFDIGSIFWPLLIILLGLFLIFRPKIGSFRGDVNIRPLGEIDRRGAWEVADEEIWMFVGEVDLDFTQTELPEGETHIRILAFVPDVNLYIPEDMAFSLGATAFVTDFNFKGDKRDNVFVPVDYTTANYREAARKLRVELTCFVADLDVR
jgi:predicted membrane protein